LIVRRPGYTPVVRRFGKASISLAAVLLLWAGFAYDVTRPADQRDYHRTVVQVAESAHDGVRTGWLVGREQLAGRVFGTFVTTTFDDAEKAVAGASKQFASEAPPDEASTRLRDELSPLLQSAINLLADASEPTDDAALRQAVDELGRLADQLDAFVAANQ
jgi:acyl-CoA reductase-like NAD-dependent aldehyde dehydrogenase